MKFLRQAIARSRATLVIMLFVVIAGIAARGVIPVDLNPPVNAPFVMVMVPFDGISPEDGVRLLVRPMETEIQRLEGVEEMTAIAREGSAFMVIEFVTGTDLDNALTRTREAVSRAQAEFPRGAEEPVINEAAAIPAPDLVVSFSGDKVSERELFRVANHFQQRIRGLPLVMDARMIGHREEVAEIIIDPERLDHYNITAEQMLNAVQGNNLLITAGAHNATGGRFGVKVQGLIETVEDVHNLPILSSRDAVVTLGEVARVERTFKDPTQITRFNGERTIGIEIYKRTGESTVAAVENVKALLAAEEHRLGGVEVDTIFDASRYAQQMVEELQGNIITAMVLVMIVVMGAMGLRYGLIVSLGIPFSLLGTTIIVYLLGFTFNFMVMFGLLLALGMLIDGAVVIVEYAERQYRRGLALLEAYVLAVRRMAPPVIASTATTLAVFLPLFFWPGVAGDFMRYLPATVTVVLAWSLLYALLFAPVLGVLLGRVLDRGALSVAVDDGNAASEDKLEVGELGRFGQFYASALWRVLSHPLRTLAITAALLVAIFVAYATLGAGTQFFVSAENQHGFVAVRARGNLTVEQMDALAAPVAERVLAVPGVKSVLVNSGSGGTSLAADRDRRKDEVANILVELEEASERERSSRDTFAAIRRATRGFPGIIVSTEIVEGGPPVGREIQIQLGSEDRDKLHAEARRISDHVAAMAGLRDQEDTLPLPGIDWHMEVDRPRAAMAGVSVADIGRMLQLVTHGLQVGEYRPDDAEEEVEIRVRYPAEDRTLAALDNLRVTSPGGPVSPAAFVERKPRQRVDNITRVDQTEVVLVKANTVEGVLPDTKVREIREWLDGAGIDPGVEVTFRGANEEQAKGTAFLSVAFSFALFLMLILLVVQFNNFYQAVLILSAVIMSTAGVMLGLLLTGKAFSVIMTGTGIVALAGIVVNNNIVLIDTYNHFRNTRPDLSRRDQIHLAAVTRLRPVLLTAVTTIVGLLPLANGFSIDIVNRTFEVGGMVASWWSAMSSAIVHGLTMATLLTLVVTPALLALPDSLRRGLGRITGKPVAGGSRA